MTLKYRPNFFDDIYPQIPNDWSWVGLTEICSPRQWATISNDLMSESGYPVYGANGIIGFYEKYNHEDPVVAISCRGACGDIHLTKKKSYVTGNAMCLDQLSEEVDLKYLYHALNYRTLKDAISGSAQPQITQENLHKVYLPIPVFREQKEISRRLDTVDKLIKTIQIQINKLQDLKKGILDNFFVEGFKSSALKDSEIGKIPKTWGIRFLSDVCSIKHGYPFESQFFSNDETEYTLLTPGNFNIDGSLYYGEKTKYYKGDVPSEYILSSGDILVVMTDLTSNMAILGNAVILNSQRINLHNQRIGKVVNKSADIKNEFLVHLINSYNVKSNIKKTATGTTVKHTSPSKILEILVPIPTIEDQTKICKICDSFSLQVKNLTRKLEKIKMLKKSLMQELLTGKVRVKVN